MWRHIFFLLCSASVRIESLLLLDVITCEDDYIPSSRVLGAPLLEAEAVHASGFIPAYEAKFGEDPRGGEAQLFDALYLVYYSLKAMRVDGRELVEDATDVYGRSCRQSPLWEYFIKIVDTDKSMGYSWFDYDVYYAQSDTASRAAFIYQEMSV